MIMAGYTDFPFEIFFKRYYCKECGNKLLKVKKEIVYSKDDPGYNYHRRKIDAKTLVLGGDISVTKYIFGCEKCRLVIDANDQVIVDSIQKDLKKKVLTRNECSINMKPIEWLQDPKRLVKNEDDSPLL